MKNFKWQSRIDCFWSTTNYFVPTECCFSPHCSVVQPVEIEVLSSSSGEARSRYQNSHTKTPGCKKYIRDDHMISIYFAAHFLYTELNEHRFLILISECNLQMCLPIVLGIG